MEITVQYQQEIKQVMANLAMTFPKHMVKHPLLNKKVINVIDCPNMVILTQKDDKIKISSGVNIVVPSIFIVLMLLFGTGIIVGLMFYAILIFTNRKETKVLKYGTIISCSSDTYNII